MEPPSPTFAARARRAYELGRLETSALRAAGVVAALTVPSYLASGPSAFGWMPVAFVLWVVAFWRGEAVLRGAWRGLLAGGAALVLPMSLLRPCCVGKVMHAGETCCTMPSACLASGAVVGFALAVLLPPRRDEWARTAAGMALGAASIAMFRCTTLFAGEALGLVGGLVAGLWAASAARAWLGRARA